MVGRRANHRGGLSAVEVHAARIEGVRSRPTGWSVTINRGPSPDRAMLPEATRRSSGLCPGKLALAACSHAASGTLLQWMQLSQDF